MMTVSEYSRNSFLNEEWVPIANAVHSTTLDPGVQVTIDNGGSGYDPDNTIFVISGDVLGCHIRPIIYGGVITGFEVIDAGTGYNYANVEVWTPDLTKPQGSGAQISVSFP